MARQRQQSGTGDIGDAPRDDAAGEAGVRLAAYRVGDEEYLALSVPIAAEAASSREHGLTDAELAVVQGVLEGRSNAEIAAARATSPRTIANQLASIFRKLGVGSRTELAALWSRRAAGDGG